MPVPDEPIRRTEAIEEISNLWLIHPVSGWLVRRFVRAGIKPNTVSFTGMGFGILAGLAYTQYRHWGFCVLGFLLMLGWHVMDGADGQLARLTQSQSELGKILDGICDYVTFIAVYAGLGAVLAHQYGPWVVLVVACAGACHAVQAAAYETQRQAYDFYGNGKLSAAIPEARALPARTLPERLYRGYATVQRALTATPPGFGVAGAKVQSRYRAAFAPAVRRWGILSSNYRTLGIFLCAVAGHPLVYFWFEIFGLSAILALLFAGQRRRVRVFMAGEAGTAG